MALALVFFVVHSLYNNFGFVSSCRTKKQVNEMVKKRAERWNLRTD